MAEAAEAIEHTEQPTPRKRTAKRRRRAAPRRQHAEEAAPFRAPDEFAGMTATDCCDACLAGKAEAEAARRRLNEIDAAAPRQPTRIPNNETVLELDPEWKARNPQYAVEFDRLTAKLNGCCIISGSVCAHPFKSPLQSAMFRDPVVLERYQRAKKALKHQVIDLRGQ